MQIPGDVIFAHNGLFATKDFNAQMGLSDDRCVGVVKLTDARESIILYPNGFTQIGFFLTADGMVC